MVVHTAVLLLRYRQYCCTLQGVALEVGTCGYPLQTGTRQFFGEVVLRSSVARRMRLG